MLSLAETFPEIARSLGEAGTLEAFEIGPADDVGSLADADRDWLSQRVAEKALELAAPGTAVGDLFPLLTQCADQLIASEHLSLRSRNILGRCGIRRWRDLGGATVAELSALPGAGRTSVLDMLKACAEQSLALNGSEAGITSRVDSADSVEAPVAEDRSTLIAPFLSELAAWAVLERNISKLGDFLRIEGDDALPDDALRAWRKVADLDARRVADPVLLRFALPAFIERLRESLTGNLCRVYEGRVLSDTAPTLEQIGQELGVTRERVRQLQSQAESRVADLLNTRDSAPFRWRAAALASVLGPHAPSDDARVRTALETSLRGCDPAEYGVSRRLMLRVAGPYVERDGWLVRQDASLPNPVELTALADTNGLIPVSQVYEWLLEKGMDTAYHDHWIDEQRRVRHIGGHVAVWAGSVVEKAAALLAASGEPSSAEALVATIGEGHNVRGVRQRLFEDERFVRVSRTDWALRSWGLEEYTGIAEEIAQRIEEGGGRARLSDLVRELVPLFGVKESSVRVYAEAPMFVLEDGWVRLRRSDERYLVNGDITRCRGVYRPAPSVVSYLVTVDRDVLRGSGRTLPAVVASVLGVLPGDKRSFTTSDEVVVITWPSTSAVGPSLGSTRAIAERVGAEDGDLLRLTFNCETATLSGTRITSDDLAAANPDAALLLLTGVDTAGRDANTVLAEAVGVHRESLRRTLAERGDPAEELLPPLEIDESLRGVLGDLAAALDGSG
jgi:hypothetical protein